MKRFEQWLEAREHPDAEVNIDGARVGFNVTGDVATIVSFEGLNWKQPGVIDRVIKTVAEASGAREVTTTAGIRQHWSHAGYQGK